MIVVEKDAESHQLRSFQLWVPHLRLIKIILVLCHNIVHQKESQIKR